ncbi:BlaI/MecI/CopY family transcriptional regulator [Streptomyces sp. NPDC007084]|uniref:BlaI/MecI/CopY family transcriptional regulator n=1 Tax=Streptomyces sp. NPDC007084 TaxID=3154313 RepID=UPI00345170BD
MPDTPHVLHEYAERLRADLKVNEQERERLRGVLHQLEQEYEILLKMQVTLDAEAAAVADLLQNDQAAARALARTPGPAVKTEPAPTADESYLLNDQRRGRRPGERPLIDVVSSCLREQGEPRSVSEIRKAVMNTRPASEQTVRNTLDRLVATSKAERTKQGRSVFYSATAKLLDSSFSPTRAKAAAE